MLSLVKVSTVENAKVVKVFDYSDYESERSCNGGCYGFWTTFTRRGNKFEVTYGTTSDFEFCRYCGHFGRCDCDSPEIVTLDEVVEAVNNCLDENDPDNFWVEVNGQRIDY